MATELFYADRRLLTVDDINDLKVFDKIGIESSYTDFAYALGGELATSSDTSKDYKSIYQLKSNKPSLRYMVVGDRVQSYYSKNMRGKGARLVTNIPFNKEGDVQTDSNGVSYVYYGEYPQTVAPKENLFYINKTKDAVAKYVVPRNCTIDIATAYKLNGEKYVLVKLFDVEGEKTYLSNGIEIHNGETVAFKVEPIKWILDEETGLLISEKILSYGIDYDSMNNHRDNVRRLTLKNKNE